MSGHVVRYLAGRTARFLSGLFDRRGNTALSLWFSREARRLLPDDHAAGRGEAAALFADGRFDDVEAVCVAILSKHPDDAFGTNLLGASFLARGRLDEAERCFRRAIDLDSRHFAAWNNLGSVKLEQGQAAEAERAVRQALSLNPLYAEAACNLGQALNRQGRTEEAEAICRRAIELKPDYAGAHNNLANVLLNRNQRGEAERHYREALRLKPDLAEAHINLAIALGEPAYLIGAVDYYERELGRTPDAYLANMRLGQAYIVLGRYEDAQARFETALKTNPRSPEVISQIGNVFSYQGLLEPAVKHYGRALKLARMFAHLADDQGRDSTDRISYDALEAAIRMCNGIASPYVFSRLYDPTFEPQALFAEMLEWGRDMAVAEIEPHGNDPQPERRLRVGYVSRDFANHSVSFFIGPVLRGHDRAMVEVFAYANMTTRDAVSDRLESYCDHWRDIHTDTVDEVCTKIREDRIDILVDLSGHTSGHRLEVFARKPAPVQVTYLGCPSTTGLAAMDYRLTDAIADPPGMTEDFHSERLLRVEPPFLCYQPPDDAPPVAPPPCRERGFITFGSFNTILKVNAQVVALWSEVLQQLPGSRLVLKALSFSGEAARKHYLDLFAAHGIGPERLDLLAWSASTASHLELYGDIDIALDPFPYNGTTTTCEALWMGVPVLTLAGSRHSARVGASLLQAIGRPELVAERPDEFVRLAVALAGDRQRLERLRHGMREQMRRSALMDVTGFCTRLEEKYRQAWRYWCAQAGDRADAGAQASLTATLPGGVRLALSDRSLGLSAYVLEEQGDWFEDEIVFFRKVLRPGMKLIDIGANAGIYALTAAAIVGPTGRVWAFEPASATRRALLEGIGINGLTNVEVVAAAVSDFAGEADLSIEAEAEANRIGRPSGSTGRSERVAVGRLDDFVQTWGWPQVDFIKIDAEGQELAIVEGAGRLFVEQSPLVMAEFKHGSDYNLGLVAAFERLGYRPYLYLRSLGCLLPFDPARRPDEYLLNLFFLKAERARELRDRALLVDPLAPVGVPPPADTAGWQCWIDAFPYARAIAGDRPFDPANALMPDGYGDALAAYARSRRDDLPLALRFSALQVALAGLAVLVERQPDSLPIRMSWIRVLIDCGQRDAATVALNALVDRWADLEPAGIRLPFIAVSERFESRPVRGRLEDWVLASVLDASQHYGFYSSYFSGPASYVYLSRIRELGYGDPQLDRRLEMLLAHLRRQHRKLPASA